MSLLAVLFQWLSPGSPLVEHRDGFVVPLQAIEDQATACGSQAAAPTRSMHGRALANWPFLEMQRGQAVMAGGEIRIDQQRPVDKSRARSAWPSFCAALATNSMACSSGDRRGGLLAGQGLLGMISNCASPRSFHTRGSWGRCWLSRRAWASVGAACVCASRSADARPGGLVKKSSHEMLSRAPSCQSPDKPSQRHDYQGLCGEHTQKAACAGPFVPRSRDYCSSDSICCGMELAWANTEVPACCRIWVGHGRHFRGVVHVLDPRTRGGWWWSWKCW